MSPKTAKAPSPQFVLPDLTPFVIDRVLLGPLNSRGAKVPVVAVAAVLLAVFGVTWCAAVSGLLFPLRPELFLASLEYFLLARGSIAGSSIPYLLDIPSMLLTIVIPASLAVVYALYVHASTLHSKMAATRCLRVTDAGSDTFARQVGVLNAKFVVFGKFSFLAFFLSVGAATLICLSQNGSPFESSPEHIFGIEWWASSVPFRPGFVVWSLLGGVGIYTVYIEAVLGLYYRRFLRTLRNSYQFRGNPYNPDGYFGWRSLRSIISNLELGIVFTAVTIWSMWHFLSGPFGVVGAGAVLSLFAFLVAYVFYGVTTSLRAQVEADKAEQILELQSAIETLGTSEERDKLASYRKLEMVQAMPATPVRRASSLALYLALLVPLVEIARSVTSSLLGTE